MMDPWRAAPLPLPATWPFQSCYFADKKERGCFPVHVCARACVCTRVCARVVIRRDFRLVCPVVSPMAGRAS